MTETLTATGRLPLPADLDSPNRAALLRYAVYHVLASYGQLGMLLAVWPMFPSNWLLGGLYFVAMGWTQYRLYFLVHDACHFTLFPSVSTNRLVGRITAATLFSSFTTFTAVHMQHHRHYGTERDLGAVDYYVRFRSRWQSLWFFLWPLLGLGVFEKVSTNVAQPLRRTLGGGWRQPTATPQIGSAKGPAIPAVDVLFVVGIQALILLAMSSAGTRPLDYVFFYVLPGGTIFLFLARLRMYLEHGPLDYEVSDYLGAAPRRIARTHLSTLIEAPLFQYMNFRFHNEHHLWPGLPSAQLPAAHRSMRGRLHPDDYSPRYIDSLRRIVHLANTGGIQSQSPQAAAR